MPLAASCCRSPPCDLTRASQIGREGSVPVGLFAESITLRLAGFRAQVESPWRTLGSGPLRTGSSSRPRDDAHEVRVVHVRRRCRPAIKTARPKPIVPSGTRIDQGQGPFPALHRCLVRQDLTKRCRSDREACAERRTIVTDTSLVHLGCQQKEAPDDPGRLPAQSPGCGPCLALIPAQCSFDRAEIADLRLDLDHDGEPKFGVEGEDIDPAARAIASYFDFGRRLPAGPLESSHHVRRTTNMSRVSLGFSIAEEWSRDTDGQSCAHDLKQTSRTVEGQIGNAHVLDH